MQMMARELHWVLIFTTKDDSCSFCGQGFLLHSVVWSVIPVTSECTGTMNMYKHEQTMCTGTRGRQANSAARWIATISGRRGWPCWPLFLFWKASLALASM